MGNETMSKALVSLLIVGLALAAQAQIPDAPSATKPPTDTQKPGTRHGVGPYLGTGNAGDKVEPLSVGQKFGFAAWNSFSLLTYPEVALIAGIKQASNQQPTWGQGAEGFGKRLGASFADQAIGNVMAQAVFPSLLKQDPRYFRSGRGGFGKRVGYGLSRLWVTRRDDGTRTANLSEIVGTGVAAGISRIYYPSVDRTAAKTLGNWGIQLGIAAGWNEFYEFWPDIRHAIFRK